MPAPESHALDALLVGSPGNPPLVLGISVARVGNRVCCDAEIKDVVEDSVASFQKQTSLSEAAISTQLATYIWVASPTEASPTEDQADSGQTCSALDLRADQGGLLPGGEGLPYGRQPVP